MELAVQLNAPRGPANRVDASTQTDLLHRENVSVS